MAKADVRIVNPPEDIKGMVDKGTEVDNEVKNLTFEDKACKQGITDFVEGEIGKDEQSVMVEGKKSFALVSKARSYKVDAGADTFPEMKRTAKMGLLGGVVKMTRNLIISQDSIDEAVKILNDAGIDAWVGEEFAVKPADYRKHKDLKTASEDVQKATDALDGCLSMSESFRVKYQAKGE